MGREWDHWVVHPVPLPFINKCLL